MTRSLFFHRVRAVATVVVATALAAAAIPSPAHSALIEGGAPLDWYLELAIPAGDPSGGPAVFTGSSPFDTSCPEAGHDCSATDSTVRSGDSVTFTWAVTATSIDDLQTPPGTVILEQTLELHDGAIANFARIPARCLPSGGGGAAPASTIVDQGGTVIPEGTMPPVGTTSVTLRCNVGALSHTGDAVTVQPVVRVSPYSPNDSTFSTVANAYAVNDDGTAAAVPADPRDFGPIEITSAPSYELEKKGFFNLEVGTRDIGDGPEPGYYTYAVIQVKSNRTLGVQALQQPITISEDLFGIAPNGIDPIPGMKFAITECVPNLSAWAGTVGGRAAPYGEFTDSSQTVVDSGECAIARNDDVDLTSDYALTFSGIDMSGSHYPTEAGGGADLSAGPFYVASYRVQVFIPASSMDAADGVLDDGQGSLQLYNRVGGFDPVGIDGESSNFGDGVEPGYCEPESVDGQGLSAAGMPHCESMSDGDRSDNVIGPLVVTFGGVGFAKYILNTHTLYSPDWEPADGVTNLTGLHAGNGTGEPGQVYESFVDFENKSFGPFSGSRICDVFDNTVFSLVSSAQGMTAGGDPAIYAVLAADQFATTAERAAYSAQWVFEYGHLETTGDDPIAGGTVDPVTARIAGTWADQASKTCADQDAVGGWQTDPASVPGGAGEVNAVRVRPGIDPATGEPTLQPSGVNNRLIFSMQIRPRFHGGPHDGERIPSGTVGANYAHVRTDSANEGQWFGGSYTPSPENSATDGDRITVTQATLAIQQRSITVDGLGDGAADFGVTGAAVASNPIVWEIASSLSSSSETPADVTGLTITDVLPPYAAYDPDCTASISGGTPADEVIVDFPDKGKTTLVWHLGQWTPNTDIPNRRICTNSDPLSPNGVGLVNKASITFDGSPVSPSDTHTVVIEQSGSVQLRKAVDAVTDPLDDDQVYSLAIQNFSDTLVIAPPTFIEVFPYIGDATSPGGPDRTPASDFSGSLVLAGVPMVASSGGAAYDGQFWYTTDAPATINQNLNANRSTWLTGAQLNGDLSAVTAIKFVGAHELSPITAPATSGLTVNFTLHAGGNRADDVYSDRFTAFSDTFMSSDGVYQPLVSNRTTVRTVAPVVPIAASSSSESPAGALAHTGSDVRSTLILGGAIGGGVVLVGAALLLSARRRQRRLRQRS